VNAKRLSRGSPEPQSPPSTQAVAPAARVAPRGILFDMDGVLYDADRLIVGAAETVQWVKSEGIPHLFVTNTTSRSRADLAQKLATFGIAAAEGDILTPILAAVDWLRGNPTGSVHLYDQQPGTTSRIYPS
jgi:ribonucleotide monophosphatase NagD (HAD superfamily)